MSTATMRTSVSDTTSVGPVNKWKTPDDAVVWLRRNILTNKNFNLAQWEQGQMWVQRVGSTTNFLDRRDAQIILEFTRLTSSEVVRLRVVGAMKALNELLDRDYDVQRLQGNVAVWARKLRSGLGHENVQVVARFVHLSRRWPR